jgi:type IV pilus assembly protein PilE
MSRKNAGFTLIELMISVVVLAILGSLAMASYRSSVLRSNRTDASTTVLRVAVAEEKYFLQNSQYTADLASAAPTGLGIGATTPLGYYTLTVTAGSTGSLATSWKVTASATGAQLKDIAACQILSIDDQGVRSPNDASGCWK